MSLSFYYGESHMFKKSLALISFLLLASTAVAQSACIWTDNPKGPSFGDVSVVPSAGALNATEANIVAVRLY